MTLEGFDAWGMGPTPAAARAAGMGFRTWYSSYDGSKDGPVDGPARYGEAGIWSVCNFETTIDRVLSGGAAGGQVDMEHAINEYGPRGMPEGAAVILSADEPIPASAFPRALAYYQGARQAAAGGRYLTGCYGEQALIAYLKQHAAIEVGWRSMSTAWPGGGSSAFCDLVQTGSGTIGGVEVDFDEALVPFVGQWMPGRLAPRHPAPDPAPLPKEADMILLTGFNGPAVAALSGALLWDVQDGTSVAAYKAAGVPVATITAAEHAAIAAASGAAHAAASGTIPVTLSGSGNLTLAAA